MSIRYDRIFSLPRGKQIEVEGCVLREKFDESIADLRYFQPTRESVKSVPAGAVNVGYYDFPDGRDTGIQLPIGRKRGVDISEISSSVINEQLDVNDKVNVAKEKAKLKKQLDDIKQSVDNKNNVETS